MEKMIDKSRAYETYRLAWDDIAKLLSDQIKAVLGRRFLLRVWPEDQGYWGARALHGRFSEDVHGFGMTLGSLLLKAALQADWKCEMVEDDALWMIGFVSSETRPYTVSGLLRSLNTDALLKLGLELNGEKQKLSGAVVFPEDYFNPRSSVTGELRKTENTHSIHWYSASWMPWHKRLRSAISKPVHFILGRAKGRGR